jgi:SAM-dependent methyltransferase
MGLGVKEDAFGQEMMAYLRGEAVHEIVEREDGYINAAAHGPAMYFAPYESWISPEKEAIGHARGRTLDVGCGAGRVCLYLQEKGQEVLGIDNSPGALEVCRQRGVKETRLLSITKISRRLGIFETIVMFGNNFGLLGSPMRAKYLLKRLHRMTSPAGRILAVSNDIYQTKDPDHLAYHEYNRRRGRMAGQIRIRIRFKHSTSAWFDYLLVSPEEMAEILEGTGWRIQQVISAEGTPVYAAVVVKARHSFE